MQLALKPTSNSSEANTSLSQTEAETEIWDRRETEASTGVGGDRDDWRKSLPTVVRQTLKRREKQLKEQYQKRYGRFAGILVTNLVLAGCFLIFSGVASAKTITVTGTGDTIAVDGVVTLREAMTAANSNVASGDAPAGDAGVDTIKFSIPGVGVHTITLGSALPVQTVDPVVIDGTSQPGYAGTPLIEINGNNIAGSGIHLEAGNSKVMGLIINRVNGNGILLITGDGNTITANYIGTNAAGTAALANTESGISIQNSSTNNVIGGSAVNRNVISGNTHNGISISSGDGTIIRGNYIGLNASGTAAVGNGGNGVRVFSNNNSIGGNGQLANVISGNNRGISLEPGASGNVVPGNYIGTNAAGTAAIPNAQDGIIIAGSNNTIGGVLAGNRNIISGNTTNGILLSSAAATGNFIQGNLIGTNAAGTAAVANASYGIRCVGCSNTTIGGSAVGARNVISGNGRGVAIEGAAASGNTIQGNYIGLNFGGTSKVPNNGAGLELGGPNNFVGGTGAGAGNVISGNANEGIGVGAVSGNDIKGNFIGTNPTGTASLGNTGPGIRMIGATNTTIGGIAGGSRNIISGNGSSGISLESVQVGNNLVQQNLIGTDVNGTAKVANGGTGIRIISASHNTIGGTSAAARNVISGNGGGGLTIENNTSAANSVLGNYIGVNINGTAALGNNGGGVSVSGFNNAIGDTVAGAGNVISGNGGNGVSVTSIEATGNMIQGNLIGTNAAGTAALGNGGIGVRIIDAVETLVGGTTAPARNVISGNFRGVTLEGSGNGQNTVQGNYIGTDISGTLNFGNSQEGISIGTSNNTIGGTLPGARNLISGNKTDGIRIEGANASGNVVQGNFIGTKADGATALPNTLLGVTVYGASNNTIGGTAAGAGNTIAENSYAGVFIWSGTGNAVLGNSIFNHPRLGIEIDGGDSLGLIENDLADPDFGANWRQNYPLLSSVTNAAGQTTFQGTLNSNPNKQFRIEFFSNNSCDGSGFGEGKTYLGSTDVNTNGAGNATINVSLPVNPVGTFVTATATSPTNDTSEFSPCALVGGPNPGVLQFASTFFIVEEAQLTAKIMVTRSSGMAGPVSVQYASVPGGSATANTDYTPVSGTLNFADGEVIKSFNIPVVDDGAPESQESVNLTLSAPAGGAALGINTNSSLLINNSDPAFPAVSFSNATLAEGDSGSANMVFTINLTPHSAPITVGYTTANGSATAPGDYQTTAGQLIFNPGENSKQVSVPIFGDVQQEGDEVFFLNLNSLSTGYVLDGQGSGLIVDDDSISKFHFSQPTYSVNENGASVNITVDRLGDTSVATSVDYATSNGTATAGAGQDYLAASGTLAFGIGETSKNFSITINDDPAFEGDETVNLTLTNPSNGGQLINPSAAMLTIVNNDSPPVGTLGFTATTYSVNEDGGQATITVSRTGGTTGAVSVTYTTAIGGSATINDDYTPVSNTLTWQDGDGADKSFNVPISNDPADEPTETINLGLNNPTGGASLGGETAHIDITDDDAPPTISISDSSRNEGDAGIGDIGFDVTLSAPSGKTVTVTYATVDDSAIFGNDYQPDNGILTFLPGETTKPISIIINGDAVIEPDDTFFVNLSNPTNASLNKAQGVGTILNDDNAAVMTIEFDASNYSVTEDAGHITITVKRSGDTSGAASVDFQTTDTDTFTLNCASKRGEAFGRCDFATTVGTLNFAAGETSKTFTVPIINDSYGEEDENFGLALSNPSGGTLGAVSTAIVTINDNEVFDGPNPVFSPSFFVRQHYLDFLGREPEAGEPWSAILNGCSDPGNVDPNSPAAGCDRITISGAFFGSPEFRDKGIYIIDFYRVAFNRLPTYKEFSVDLASITGASTAESNAKRAAFANNFVQRQEFDAAYGNSMNSAYVNMLMNGAQGQAYNLTTIDTYEPMNPNGPTKLTLSKNDLMTALNSSTLTRAQVLRAIVQSDQVSLNLEAVNAFVASQYYGYLRRAPDQAGFDAWVTYLKNNPTDFRTMVNGFLNSAEYKLRFGP